MENPEATPAANTEATPAKTPKPRPGKAGMKSMKVNVSEKHYAALVQLGKAESDMYPREPHIVLSILLNKNLENLLKPAK